MSKVIRVLPVETAMVPDFRALQDGVQRFIGRRHDATIGPVGKFVAEERVVKRRDGSQTLEVKMVDRPSGGFVHDGEPVDLDIQGFEKEYLEEIRHGALLLADVDSARLCGLPFKPLPVEPAAPSEAPAPVDSTTPDDAHAAA